MNLIMSRVAIYANFSAYPLKPPFIRHATFYWLNVKSNYFFIAAREFTQVKTEVNDITNRNTDSTNHFYPTIFLNDKGNCVNASFLCHLSINKAKNKTS